MLLTQNSKIELKNDRWQESNRHYLMAAIASVCQTLEQYVAHLQNQSTGEIDQPPFLRGEPSSKIEGMPAPSTLEQLCTAFGLSDFERDVLLLCAGVELKTSLSRLCARAQGDEQRTYPTFSLAMAAFPNSHWSAITPDGPLRRWCLLEVGSGHTLTNSPLRIDERVLHYLLGVESVDERLRGMISTIDPSSKLVPSHSLLVRQIGEIWRQGKEASPIVQLCGDDIASMEAIATDACAMLGLQLKVMSAMAIPTDAADLDKLLLLWEREAKLNGSVLLLHSEIDGADPARERAIAYIIENLNSLLLVTSRDRLRQRQRPLIAKEVHLPTKQEQRHLWQEAWGEMTPSLNGEVEVLVNQFNFNAPSIQAVCAEVQSCFARGQGDVSPPLPLLWNTCRAQARPRLDDLAQRLEPAADWNDLVLPEAQFQTLRSIAAHARQRIKVYEQWGFAGKGGSGLGISALFSGVSGTGKTMSAEVLAKELQLDLYRIDLSAVVSKYIGETEKNLRRVFDAAEAEATILLFDEADSLFGKRSDVKDSHDRYANMEVGYLLQRMEAYQGLVILTTNLKDSIDTAFLRRIRFLVKYTFPDASQREEIWRRIFPKNTPTKELDFAKLARLNVAGGNIRNIALNAAFIAAEAGEFVQMKHIKAAAQTEYVKLERTLTDAEVRGWT